ncbi:hypothetical protein TOPH_08231 [Tolypocladium ophioglossoides CBS 100239]|uniref:Uncharacterized protein n=1 Tax=Tolypocladium ophioglossoides (strain CBS 100239) TaxID=1163406 RepID=A0A0L0MZ86_TOLOC|nr:hypothetical protein TOPH_08231 [Tolypocladium ophioglossoides CBS 100239]
MSPWRYTRLTFAELSTDSRIMPNLLVSGIDLMHEALCVVGHAKVADFIAPHEEQARGTYKTWKRDGTKGIGAYAPFYPDNDKLGYTSWARLEKL